MELTLRKSSGIKRALRLMKVCISSDNRDMTDQEIDALISEINIEEDLSKIRNQSHLERINLEPYFNV